MSDSVSSLTNGISADDLAAAAATNLTLMRAELPAAASAAPPPVANTSAAGSAAAYARADHTHKSSVQRDYVSVPLTGSTGKGSITFKQAYDTGVTPVVITEAETPDQSGYLYLSSVVAGSITTTGFQVMVRKLNASVTLPGIATNLLNYVVSIFGLATGTVSVRYIAAPATS